MAAAVKRGGRSGFVGRAGEFKFLHSHGANRHQKPVRGFDIFRCVSLRERLTQRPRGECTSTRRQSHHPWSQGSHARMMYCAGPCVS